MFENENEDVESQVDETEETSEEVEDTETEETSESDDDSSEVEETEEEGEGEEEETPKPEPKKDSVSVALAKVARREKELRAKEGLIEEADKSKKLADELIKRAKEDPIAFLEEMNGSIEDALQRNLTKKKVDPAVKALEDKLKAMEEEKNLASKKAQEAHEAELVKSWRNSTSKLIDDKVSDFEFCSLQDRDEVLDKAQSIVEEFWKESGGKEVLPQETALKWLEEYYESLDEKLSKAKKSKRSIQKENEVKNDKEEVKPPQKTKAITQKLGGSTPTPSKVEKMTVEEARKKALEILRS